MKKGLRHCRKAEQKILGRTVDVRESEHNTERGSDRRKTETKTQEKELYQEIMWKEGKRRDKLQGRLNAYFNI